MKKLMLLVLLIQLTVAVVLIQGPKNKAGNDHEGFVKELAVEEREDRKREQPIIPVDDCAKIGIFLIQHSEFGSYSSLSSIEFIGNLPSNGKAYNVPLANGRTLQFIFRNNEIVLVGEEVPCGYIAHYGRM